jgi:hypothetical protein
VVMSDHIANLNADKGARSVPHIRQEGRRRLKS